MNETKGEAGEGMREVGREVETGTDSGGWDRTSRLDRSNVELETKTGATP